VLALRRVTSYADWRRRPEGEVPELDDVHPDRARALVAELLAGADEDLRDTDVLAPVDPAAPPPEYDGSEPQDLELLAEHVDDPLSRLLLEYGIEVWPVVPVAGEDEAVRAAAELGFPVVLKTVDPRFASRTDLGAVRLNLENERAVQTAYLSMVASFDPGAVSHLVVQRMATPGVACVVGSAEDPLFGPVVSFGLAGLVPELLGDRGYRIPPLTDLDARDLVRAPAASPMLDGVGGTEPVDRAALEDLLVRVGQIADDIPEIADLRIEPVVVSPRGLVVLGARATLRRARVRTDTGVRRLGA